MQKITTPRKWVQLINWRTKGAAGLYDSGKGFDTKTSKYTSPAAGVYYCYAMTRMDKASKSGYIALNLVVNDKADGDNGFYVIRGNKDSSNYGSLNLAGTVYLKKGDTTGLVVYSSVDSDFTVHSESGWGCHHFSSNVGFHADVSTKQTFGRLWSRVSKWRTAGNNELYAMGGAAISSSGFFVAPYDGFYACAAQVQITSDTLTYSYFRVGLFINGLIDYNNGMHTVDGNQASTNYRSMRVAGLVKLEKSNTVSVNIYSSSDSSWTLNKQSGFSCNRMKGRPACPECKIANSNMLRGKDCACKAGYVGTIKWEGNVPSGTCKPAPCNIANSNKLPGPLCKCKDGFQGELSWKGTKVSGTCKAAPCMIPGSNKQPGAACKCLEHYSGAIVWKGAVATGSCSICGGNSGFNADLKATISVKKASYFEINTFSTSGNSALYETSEKEFDKGKFAPKKDGYYQCNANVRLDGVSKDGLMRLLVAVQDITKDKKKNATYAGLIAAEGNAGAEDYRSMLITGTVAIKKGQYVSVFVHSEKDGKYKIHTESGFSCHRFNTMQGFHATKTGTTNMPRSWSELTGWTTAGAGGVYNVGGGFDGKTGRYTAPREGCYYCGAVLRLDGASATSMFRLNLVVNRQYDYSNGMHALRGYQGSTNYASISLAGTLHLMKNQYVSLVAYASTDNSYQVHTDSMWGCHRMEPKVGFHADLAANEAFKNGWNVVTKWRTTLNNELYAVGGAKLDEGVFAAPEAGYYACATQVRVEYTNFSPGKSFFRLILAINNKKDNNNGFGSIESNRQQTTFRRSMRVAGSMFLKKGDKVAVNIYSHSIKAWTANTESGFSCHKFTTHLVACPKCNAANSNKLPGPDCKCLPGFKGSVKYDTKSKTFTGTCAKSKCTVKNSNMQDGENCKCKDHYTGKITWDDTGSKGSCVACGPAKGFNADLITSIYQNKAGWREVTNWRTTANNELYATDGSLDGSKGRFKPNQNGYFLCNANVRLDSLSASAEARLNIGLNGKPDEVNGLSVAEGNGGSTNYRSLTISGTLKLKKTDFASVFTYAKGDNTYYIRSDSGFSCQLLHSPHGFHASKNGELVHLVSI